MFFVFNRFITSLEKIAICVRERKKKTGIERKEKRGEKRDRKVNHPTITIYRKAFILFSFLFVMPNLCDKGSLAKKLLNYGTFLTIMFCIGNVAFIVFKQTLVKLLNII
jgi:hypothetical protein